MADNSTYTPAKPKEVKKEMTITPPSEGNSMSQFRKSMEDHMNEVMTGGRAGIPDTNRPKVTNGK